MISNTIYDSSILCEHAKHYEINKDNCQFGDSNFDKRYKLETHEEKHEC
jgi:hypothetical protein